MQKGQQHPNILNFDMQMSATSYLVWNGVWMIWNILLALFAVFLARSVGKVKKGFSKSTILYLLWILFLPNTLYMVTDPLHVLDLRFLAMPRAHQIFGVLMYATVASLGVYLFYLASFPIFEFLSKKQISLIEKYKILIFFLYGVIMAFAVTLGRFERENSWHVITKPFTLIKSSANVVMNTDSLVYFLLFSVCTVALVFVFSRNYQTSRKKR